ncbi:MAG TPA: TorF family putative porin [Steroidobacteraceae bacterium]|jgi:uncharacterized protein (TIGR02001 family)|nr:TorF family putative porin [Steroidobacteraceae bacterium]
MKSIKTLALVTGLLALSGVSQAQFSSTWTAVSDYDFRGFTQSAKDPALQASADYAFGDSGFAIGAWASNVDFSNPGSPVDADIELDLYGGYTGKVNDTFSWTAGFVDYTYPSSDDAKDFFEVYAGLTAGNFGFKQWYADKYFGGSSSALYSEVNYTQPIGDKFSLAFHAGYTWGDFWEDAELMDYAVQGNYTAGHFTLFAKFTGTDASGFQKETRDGNNNEGRFLVGLMTTLPWSK